MEAEGLVCERKFVSSGTPAEEICCTLRAYCMPDPKFPEGELESIYFDDARLSSYREKANGDSLKRKVRIRWYRTGGAGDEIRPAFLEIKDRIGAARDKVRFPFSAPIADLERRHLSDGFYVSLLVEQSECAGFPISRTLVPSVAIRYKRHRFVCPVTHSRVSVDYGIVCTRANCNLFPYATGEPVPLAVAICEAKSATARAWPFGEALMRLGLRMESFSKYGYFVEHMLQGGFA